MSNEPHDLPSVNPSVPPSKPPPNSPQPPAYTLHKADFTSPTLHTLLVTHHATVTNLSSNIPGQQTYALDLTALQSPTIHLWTIRSQSTPDFPTGTLLGCGALKILDGTSGEIKSMHTIASTRGQGVGKVLLDKLVEGARRFGLRVLYLETGSINAFALARSFYNRCGFVECGPFAEDEMQENSVFMF